jgi:MOSC domain-containing protein YiiM
MASDNRDDSNDVNGAPVRVATVRVATVRVGRVQPFGPNGEPSATQKAPVEGEVHLGSLGLDGDEHASPNHGGPEKALLHFAAEDYAALGVSGMGPGTFGENLSTHGMTEATVCVGDRYRIGEEVIVEVSQPRQPCWKLSYNAGDREIARLMQDHAATGWYYRIVAPGPVAAGMPIELIERPCPQWPLQRLITAFYATPLDGEFLRAARELELLGREWRAIMEKRLSSGVVEPWEARMYGPLGHAPEPQ